MADLPRLLTLNQVRDALPLGRASIYRLVDSGDLPSVRCGRRIFVVDRDLERFISKLERKGGRRASA